jgi:hypothetical protein
MTHIAGIVVPWAVSGDLTVGGKSRAMVFPRGSVTVPSDPSRVKLLIDHERGLVVGYGVSFEDTPAGLVGTFDVAHAEVIDEVAGRLMDGLSPELDLDQTTRVRLDRGRTMPEESAGVLRAVSLVAVPAFVDNRAEVVTS